MFDQLEKDIALYKRHLTDNEIEGPQIEQVFVGYVLTRIYAEFETSLRSAIKDRCRIASDPPLNEFVKSAAERAIKPLKITDLSGVLNRFDKSYKDRFKVAKDRDHQKTRTSWDNIMNNRHAFAHKAPTNMTLTEVQEDFSKAKDVIVAFREALGLSD